MTTRGEDQRPPIDQAKPRLIAAKFSERFHGSIPELIEPLGHEGFGLGIVTYARISGALAISEYGLRGGREEGGYIPTGDVALLDGRMMVIQEANLTESDSVLIEVQDAINPYGDNLRIYSFEIDDTGVSLTDFSQCRKGNFSYMDYYTADELRVLRDVRAPVLELSDDELSFDEREHYLAELQAIADRI